MNEGLQLAFLLAVTVCMQPETKCTDAINAATYAATSAAADTFQVMGMPLQRQSQGEKTYRYMCVYRAVTEAKNEVMERKKDLDTTKEKMDKLVEKLYLGRSVVSQGQDPSVSKTQVQYCAFQNHSVSKINVQHCATMQKPLWMKGSYHKSQCPRMG